MEKVCVLGTGSWGSALGLTLAKKDMKLACGLLMKNKLKNK